MMTEIPTSGRYYASWRGYDPPVQPHRPIEYGQAESSPAYTRFVFDGQGRPILFEKWLVLAAACDPSTITPLPPGRLFFAPDPASKRRPGRRISLEDTREMTAYFRAHVHPDGEIATMDHVHRERMIRHDYRYWEDGRLREWRFDSGRERGARTFDRAGRLVGSTLERHEQ